jgi:hypothetical protein
MKRESSKGGAQMKDRRIARRMLRLPSPAAVIAAIALIVATAGVATAGRSSAGSKPQAAAAVTPFITGTHVLDNSLTGADINEGTLGPVPAATNATHATSATTATTASNANALGGQTPAAFQSRIKWALVAANGTILNQSGGISLLAKPFPGEYTLSFGTVTAGKAIFAMPSNRDNNFTGGAVAAPCGPGIESYPNCVGRPPTSLHVVTFNSANTATADHSFYVMLVS